MDRDDWAPDWLASGKAGYVLSGTAKELHSNHGKKLTVEEMQEQKVKVIPYFPAQCRGATVNVHDTNKDYGICGIWNSGTV